MKQILNWTAGGFFRTLGRILVYVVLGFIISLFVANSGIKLPSWLIMKVDAATTITPSTYQHKVLGKKYNDGILESQIDSGWFTGDYTGFCSGTNRYCYLDTDYYVVTLPSSLDAGRTYTWVYNTWITDRPSQAKLNKIQYYITASNTGGYSGSSPANISSFSCRAGIEEGSTQKITFTCSITPATAVNYLYLRMDFSNLSDTINPGWRPFTSYGCNRGYLTYDNATTDAINQQTNIIQNQTDIINNNITDSTNHILDGLNGINEKNQICQLSSDFEFIDNTYLNPSGYVSSSSTSVTTDFISLIGVESIQLYKNTTSTRYICFYTETKTSISCISNQNLSDGDLITIPNNAVYFRLGALKGSYLPIMKLCKNGNQALNDTLTDDNVSDSVNKASTWMTDFETLIPENSNLVLIATLPLNLVNSIVNDNYSDLCFTLNNTEACIPSGRIIWNRTGCSIDAPFGCGNKTAFITFFNLVVGGYLAWKLLKSIYFDLHAMINPTQDAISWGVKKL